MWTSLHHPNNACDSPKVVIIHKLNGNEFIPVVETNLTAEKPLSSGVVLNLSSHITQDKQQMALCERVIIVIY